MAFCIWLLLLSFKIHQCDNMYWYPFYGWIIFYCVARPHFAYPFISRWTLGLIPFFWILWTMLLWTFMYEFLIWTYVLNFLGYISKSRSAGSHGSCETAGLFFKVASPFYIPTGIVWGFQVSHTLSNTRYSPSFLFSQSSCAWRGISLWFWFVFP